jgi:dipeptidyl aminopeptidase/acylaminoacyl peptidase
MVDHRVGDLADRHTVAMRTFALIACLCLLITSPVQAQSEIALICPTDPITTRGREYTPGGYILTSFDRAALWVYDITGNRRYPLPETYPCTTNCRLSPDARWLLYFNDATNSYNRMRVDGTQRTLVSDYASQVEWWSPDTWLIWTPGRQAYLQPQDSAEREYLDVRGVSSIQPGGRWGVLSEPDGDGFRRALIHLSNRAEQIDLGIDLAYYNDSAWSPDGLRFVYVAPVFADGDDETPIGAELYTVSPTAPTPLRITDFTNAYGSVRINGLAASALSWSPDGSRLAFWVVDLNNANATAQTARIHVLDMRTRIVTSYCRFSTAAHTPNPPRLVWSPDSTQLAFGADLPDDTRPSLLLTLDLTSGIVTIMSEGLYPALGTPDVTAWGLPPG